MKNEFQANTLQSGGHCKYPQWAKKYREPLMQAMQAAGVQPIQIQVNLDNLIWPPQSSCFHEAK